MAIPRNINPSCVNDLAWAAFCTMSSVSVDMVSVALGNASTLWLTQTSWRNIGHCLEVCAVGMMDVKVRPGSLLFLQHMSRCLTVCGNPATVSE